MNAIISDADEVAQRPRERKIARSTPDRQHLGLTNNVNKGR